MNTQLFCIFHKLWYVLFGIVYIALYSLVKNLFVRFIHVAQNIANRAVTIINTNLYKINFTDRFADQRWLIYDRRRDCGYYYDGHTARCVTLEDDRGMIADKLADEWLAEDERQFQLLWKNYFRALAIPQRINERQQRRMMPRRYWKHLTEME